jgi:hypothetical protein
VQPPLGIPQVVGSFGENTYDFSLMLSYLDNKLAVLEETPLSPRQFNYMAYAEARVFLKACYMFFRILLDDISGILEFFYKKKEPKVKIGSSFDDLLKHAKNGSLPSDLCKLLERPSSWFPEMRDRRDDLVHRYDSFLISFKQRENGKNILGHFSTKRGASKDYKDIREYFGYLLCEYQMLIDALLDFFDIKFRGWYELSPPRNLTIMMGCTALPLWWAHKYGNYEHKELQVAENCS